MDGSRAETPTSTHASTFSTLLYYRVLNGNGNGVRIRNKVHIVQAHVATYIQRTGKSLGKVSDQIVESTHSALNKRLDASKYWIKDVEAKMHGQRLLCGIVHFNCYNV